MSKILLIVATSIISFAVLAEDCPAKIYDGDINNLAEIQVSNLREFDTLDIQVVIYPREMIGDLKFYAGAVLYGVPPEIRSVMNYREENGKMNGWLMVNSKNLDKTKIFLWYRNAKCHVAATFYLNEHKQVTKRVEEKGLSR